MKRHEYCFYNERGPSCTRCSLKLSHRPLSLSQLEARYTKPKSVSCMICREPIEKPLQQAYIFPFDLHLCHKHPSLLRENIKREIESLPLAERNNESKIISIILNQSHSEKEIIEKRTKDRETREYNREIQRRSKQQLQHAHRGQTKISYKLGVSKKPQNNYNKD